MDHPINDWLLKLDESIRGLAGQWSTTKTTVIDESAALNARLERLESKLDEVLQELRAQKRP
jgi:hypothetical protein